MEPIHDPVAGDADDAVLRHRLARFSQSIGAEYPPVVAVEVERDEVPLVVGRNAHGPSRSRSSPVPEPLPCGCRRATPVQQRATDCFWLGLPDNLST